MSDGAAAADDTVKLGLLLEAAHTHQQLLDDSLARLEAHTQGLDAVVRDEIRHTFVAECGALANEANRLIEALQRLQHGIGLRAFAWTLLPVAGGCATLLLLLAHLLPSQAELASLRAQRQQLLGEIAQLTRAGGRIDLQRCGSEQRLCVRIDRRTPAYGAGADYLIVKGY